MSLNVFHNYAHDLGCQIGYGPRRTLGFGLSDGEGNERDWSSKRHLVAAGRCSSTPRRAQILNTQSMKSALTKRLLLPQSLRLRYERTLKLIGKLETVLETAFTRPLEIGAGRQIEWGREFLQEQIESQRSVFRDWKSPSNKRKELQEVYDALRAEIEEKKRLANETLSTPSTRSRQGIQVRRELPELMSTTENLLRKHHQSRADWSVGGSLWGLFEQEKRDVVIVFEAIKKELELSELIEVERRKPGAEDPTIQQWLNSAQIRLGFLKEESDRLLRLYNLSRAELAPGTVAWDQLNCEHIYDMLTEIRSQIFIQVSRRGLELRNLRSRVMGQKNSQVVSKALKTRYPAIQKLVARYNDIASKLPPNASVIPLNPNELSIYVSLDSAQPGEEPYLKQDALFHLSWRLQGLSE